MTRPILPNAAERCLSGRALKAKRRGSDPPPLLTTATSVHTFIERLAELYYGLCANPCDVRPWLMSNIGLVAGQRGQGCKQQPQRSPRTVTQAGKQCRELEARDEQPD